MADPHANPGPPRKCSRCGRVHQRKHTYCTDCYREWKREQRRDGNVDWIEPGTPPPPPPGFDPRDLRIGKPLL